MLPRQCWKYLEAERLRVLEAVDKFRANADAVAKHGKGVTRNEQEDLADVCRNLTKTCECLVAVGEVTSSEARKEEVEVCHFCRRECAKGDYAPEGWVPSFWDHENDTESTEPACPDCVRKHLVFSKETQDWAKPVLPPPDRAPAKPVPPEPARRWKRFCPERG